jgi:uncharacterized protein
MKLYADTSGWVATFDRSDPLHSRAQPAFDSLLTQKSAIYTSDYVIAETITFLVYHSSHRLALEFGQAVQQSPRVQLIHVTEDLWQEAWQLFEKYDDKKLSFTDCVSFVIMHQRKIRDAFSFDHHFEQMGFRLWPGTSGV